ncbi:MAG: hypothetical protein KF815_09905 [Rhodospirillales bacterium]|nr:hypothetical protein [Rhodospirillales bacterium]
MPRTPTAYLSHAITGRARLKIPARRGDQAYFAVLAERLQRDCPGVRSVRVNPLTASVLIEHAEPLPPLGIFAAGTGLFLLEATPPPLPPVGPALRSAASALDRSVRRTAGGTWDLWTLLALVLLSLALVQVRRGTVLPPAVSLTWQALTALGLSHLMNSKNGANGGL